MWADEVERRRSEEKRKKCLVWNWIRSSPSECFLVSSFLLPLHTTPGTRRTGSEGKWKTFFGEEKSMRSGRLVKGSCEHSRMYNRRQHFCVLSLFHFLLLLGSKKMNPNSRRLTHTRSINPKMWFFLVLPMRLMDIFCEINFQIFNVCSFFSQSFAAVHDFIFGWNWSKSTHNMFFYFIDSIAMEKKNRKPTQQGCAHDSLLYFCFLMTKKKTRKQSPFTHRKLMNKKKIRSGRASTTSCSQSTISTERRPRASPTSLASASRCSIIIRVRV